MKVRHPSFAKKKFDTFKSQSFFKKINMAIIERYHWKVNEGSDHDFIKLHREFEDKFREKAGAIKMDLNVFASGPNFHYQADVHFTDWSGIDEWNSFFKTDEGIKFGKKVYALAEAINREFLKIIDY